MANRAELVAELEAATTARDSDDWVAALVEAGVPCGPIHDYRQVFEDPHTQAREMEVRLEHPVEGTISALGIPVKLSDTPGSIRRPAPLLGEHTGRGAARGGPLRRGDRGAVSVDWERRGPAAWVTFNRPEAHNAMTFEMYEALFAHCERADADDDVRVLVLRGAGEKAFVAGTDIRQFTEFSSPEDGVRYEATIDRIVGRLETVRKPTIALVHGFAMGSGLALAAACDLRVCTPAARFGLPIARTGRQLPVDGELRAAGRAARRGAAEGHRVHGAAGRRRGGAGDRARDRGRGRRRGAGARAVRAAGRRTPR